MKRNTTTETTPDSQQEVSSKRRSASGRNRRRSGLTTIKSLRRWVSPCIALLVVLSTLVAVVGPAAGVGAHTETQPQVQTNDAGHPVKSNASHSAERITISYTLRKAPSKTGQVLVTANITLPSDVSSLHVASPDDATVRRTHGFEHDEGGVLAWEWNGSQRHVSITYLASVNVTSGDDVKSVATGQWALFDWRRVSLEWEYDLTNTGTETEPLEVARVAGQGVAGPNFAYLGPSQTYNRTVNGTTIHLIVPKAAQPASTPQTMLSALAKAERSLQMGAQTEHVDVFIAPPPITVSGLAGGVAQNGHRDILVHQSARLATPDNVLLHEYIHTQQDYTTSDEMKWLVEASAEYYGALLAYQQGLISYEAFHSYVESESYPTAILFDSDTWSSSNVPYFKGMQTLAALDAKIRTLSNGTHSLADVFRHLNHHEGTVTYDVFVTYVSQAAGESLAGWLNKYVKSPATPNVPTTPSLYEPSNARISASSGGDTITSLIQAGLAHAPPVLFVGGIFLLLAGWARRPPTER
jgi:hypothetical protein